MIEFHSSPNPTIGVEIELQLIDDNNFDLKNISSKVLADIDKKFSDKIKYELFESMIEINTDVCNSVEEVSKDIKQTLLHLKEVLKNYNTIINCSSLHPFAKGKDQVISNDSRYKRIMNDLQIIGTRFITQGLHVHIGVDDSEKVIKINKGDALFFDTKLIHSSGDNTSKRIRFTCQTRFGNSLSNEFAAFRPNATYNPYAMKKLGRKIYD